MTRINTGKEKPGIKLAILGKVNALSLMGCPMAWRELYKHFENHISEPTFSKYIKDFLDHGFLEKKASGDKVVFIITQKGDEEYKRLIGCTLLETVERFDNLGLFTKGLNEADIMNFLKNRPIFAGDIEREAIKEAKHLDIGLLSIFASTGMFALGKSPIEITLKVKTDPKKLLKKINEDIEQKKNPEGA